MKFVDSEIVHLALAQMWCEDAMSERIAAAIKLAKSNVEMWAEYERRWLEYKVWLRVSDGY